MSRNERMQERIKHLRRFFRRGDMRLGDVVGENSLSDFLEVANSRQLKWAAERVRRAHVTEHAEPGKRSRSLRFLNGDQNGMKVSVEFENEVEHGVLQRQMKVQVRGGDAGATYSVIVDGNELGSMTMNQRGVGVMRLSTRPNHREQEWTWAEARSVSLKSTLELGGSRYSSTIGGQSAYRDLSRSAQVESFESEVHMRGSGGIRGSAEWEIEPEHGGIEQKFTVKVRGAEPGQSLGVSLDGVHVGDVLVDGRGRGRLELTNRPNDPSEVSLPGNFPGVSAGSQIQIGSDLSGVFGQGTGESESSEGSGDAGEVELKARLAMDAGRGLGRAKFEQEFEHGQLELKLDVAVRNLDPNQDLVVQLGGESLGVLHTNGRGAGRLQLTNMPDHFREMALPENFSGVSSGTSITVGNAISGVFALSSS